MNYKVTAFAVMSVVGILLSSCVSDDSTYTSYDDVLISAFSLGNVKCTKHIKKSNGTDSTYTYSYAASAYPMSIDQIHDSIFNTYPLVMNTNVSKVLTSVTTKNSGTVKYLKLDTADEWVDFSTSDSIDYTRDRKFRVYSSNGENHRDYTVHVNINKYEENSGTWEDSAYTFQMDGVYANISSAVLDGEEICAILTTQDSRAALYTSDDCKKWVQKSAPASPSPCDTVIVLAHDKLYMRDNANNLYASADSAKNWVKVGNYNLKTLLGGNEYDLYAVDATDQIVRMFNGENVFRADSMENIKDNGYSNVKYLPYRDVTFMTTGVKTNDDILRYIMVGNPNPATIDANKDTTIVVWNKMEDVTEKMPWFYTAFNALNKKYVLPILDRLTATYFNDYIYAMGGVPSRGIYKGTAAFSKMYYSPDCGVTWHCDSSVEMPSDYTTTNLSSVKLLSQNVWSDGETQSATLYLVALYNVAGQNSVLKVWKSILHKTDSLKYYFY